MPDTILIVEDDQRIAAWTRLYLERAGFRCEIAREGETGLELARNLCPDLIVLDLMLPGLDGMSLCGILRDESDVPIIMLTAKGSHADRIAGLQGGADDYMVKPFDAAELVARVQALLRRYGGRAQHTLRCGKLVLDQTSGAVSIDTETLETSPAQLALLSVLMRHANQTLSRRQLIDLAFGRDFAASDRAVDTHIRRLRKLIHREGFEPIQSVYGVGYRLVCKEA